MMRGKKSHFVCHVIVTLFFFKHLRTEENSYIGIFDPIQIFTPLIPAPLVFLNPLCLATRIRKTKNAPPAPAAWPENPHLLGQLRQVGGQRVLCLRHGRFSEAVSAEHSNPILWHVELTTWNANKLKPKNTHTHTIFSASGPFLYVEVLAELATSDVDAPPILSRLSSLCP